jgi:FlaA1/EpsC-like NDP-sugar epimerase
MVNLENKTVLVTGGGGFIGAKLVEQITDHDPAEIRVFDNDEQRLFHLERRLKHREEMLHLVLGDLRDRDRLQTEMEGVDVVLHAGAIKHVELSEYNPYEAVQTNIQGTQNVIRAALEEGVDSVTAVSTDKASNPISVMGATKLIMERLVVAANTYHGTANTNFNCVRFGNVLGSTGSVVPLFLEQIKEGGPITVTDPDMTRFLMSIDRAVNLILDAHGRMTEGEVVVLKMPAFRVGDLAEGLRTRYAPEYDYAPEEIDIEIVGRRPGERIHEKLIAPDELNNTHELDDMFVIRPEIDLGYDDSLPDPENSLTSEYTSADADFLSPDEIATMVEQTRIPTRLVE